ncbi:MAG TPA: hypothetical protein VNN20_15610 [Thermodesulfobacteriota bacterium]|nr:hypothetical protein [Thermodesulfobacteriota bacterium]
MEDSHKDPGPVSHSIKNSIYSFFSNEYTSFIIIAIFIGFFAGLANFAFVEVYRYI